MTAQISIEVTTQYIDKESRPNEARYVYAYTITIENSGTSSAQLISRYWKIIDANEKEQEVQGLGVIGEQPTLAPGQRYQYTSGAVIGTETGIMEGHYTMQAEDGEHFDTPIPPFALVKPSALH